MNWCILIPLLVGLISAILGYLLGKLFGKGNNDVDIDVWKKKVNKLEADLEACRSSKSKSDSSLGFASKTSGTVFDADLAKSVFGKRIKQDDLTVVEGIGPKIQQLFHNHGIKTWKQLSEASVETCQKVLDSGGERFRIHTPRTWPEQARLAYEGKWQELYDWQEELDGGK